MRCIILIGQVSMGFITTPSELLNKQLTKCCEKHISRGSLRVTFELDSRLAHCGSFNISTLGGITTLSAHERYKCDRYFKSVPSVPQPRTAFKNTLDLRRNRKILSLAHNSSCSRSGMTCIYHCVSAPAC